MPEVSSRGPNFGYPALRTWHLLLITLVIAVAYFHWTSWKNNTEQQLFEKRKQALWAEQASPTERIQSLTWLIENDPQVIPKLVHGLSDETAEVRKYCAIGLGRLGPEAHDTIPQLIERLSDPEAAVRKALIDSLKAIRQDPELTIPALIDSLGDQDEQVSHAAAMALCQFGPGVIPAVCEQSDHASAQVRRQVIAILQCLLTKTQDRNATINKTLRTALRDRNADVRASVYQLLVGSPTSHFPPASCEPYWLTLDETWRGLRDSDPRIRLAACAMIAHFGQDAAPAVPDLVRLLHSEDLKLKELAMRALGRIGPPARAATADLLRILKSDNPELYHLTAETLVTIDAPEHQVLPPLVELFWRTDLKSRLAPILARINAHDDAVLSCLVELLRQPGNRNQYWAYQMTRLLRRHNPGVAEALIPELIGYLKDSNVRFRMMAATSLTGLGTQAARAVPALIGALGDPQDEVRAEAAAALEQVGPEAVSAVPALVAALKDSHRGVRRNAIAALCAICPDPNRVIPQLVTLFDHEDSSTRLAAIRALGQIGPDPNRVIPQLVALFDHEDSNTRLAAIRALGQIGPAAKHAVPDLAALVQHENADIRGAALQALGQIGPEARPVVPKLLILFEIALQRKQFQDGLAVAEVLQQIGADEHALLPQLLELYWDRIWQNDAARGLEGRMFRTPNSIRIGVGIRSVAIADIARVMAKINAHDDAVLSCLADLLRQGPPFSGRVAASGLRKYHPGAAAAFVPELVERLKHSNAETRIGAASALSGLGPKAAAAIPALIAALDDPLHEVRDLAIVTLGKIGPAAQDAIPALLSLFRKDASSEPPRSYLSKAAEAILEIDPGSRSKIPRYWIPAHLRG